MSAKRKLQGKTRRGLTETLFALLLCVSSAGKASAVIGGEQGSQSLPAQGSSPRPASILPPEITEGPCSTVQITAGPFDIHRKYRSMEGPWVASRFRIGDVVFSGNIDLPESKVHYVENDNETAAPAMNSSTDKASEAMSQDRHPSEDMDGLVDTSKLPRALLWFKGIKVEVLDENDKPLKTCEFICHSNVEVEPAYHNKIFPEGERWTQSRLATLTQGQTSVMLPSGFGVPVASDEIWRLSLQAANRTTDQHRRVKQRATLYFIKDSDLVTPITALNTRTDFVNLVIDRNSEKASELERRKFPHCDVTAYGVNAPNNVIGGTFEDKLGRRRSGHWVVPPGIHKYSSVISQDDVHFSERAHKVRAAWVHVHPLCEHVYITQCTGSKKSPFFSADIRSKIDGGLEILDIKPNIGADGILLPKGVKYQLEGEYNNPLETAVDSMISVGLYMEDPAFARPLWALPDHKADYCGIDTCTTIKGHRKDRGAAAHGAQQLAAAAAPPAVPQLFNAANDGPILQNPAKITLETTAGDLHIVLEPALAPVHATQMTKLFEKRAFDGTKIFRYMPGYLIQVSSAEDKALGAHPNPETSTLIRRLPLEAATKQAGQALHKRFALSMSRQLDDENSASTSFSILLTDAPHLDGKYTVFGHIEDDPESRETISRIIEDWDAERPAIVTTKKVTTR